MQPTITDAMPKKTMQDSLHHPEILNFIILPNDLYPLHPFLCRTLTFVSLPVASGEIGIYLSARFLAFLAV